MNHHISGIQRIAVRDGGFKMKSPFRWKGLFKLPAAVFTNSDFFL